MKPWRACLVAVAAIAALARPVLIGRPGLAGDTNPAGRRRKIARRMALVDSVRLPAWRSAAVVCAAALAVLQPAGALAAFSAPIPSPSLDSLLAAPPAGYTPLTSATFHGRFTARDYAASYKETAVAAEGALLRDGFVDGYGLTWAQRSTGRILLEFVIALKGGSGAKDWLAYEKASDLSHPEFKHADTVAGIDTYYGVHLVSSSPTFVADAFSFVKGNDMFGVGFVSPKDDVLTLATTQVTLQYDSAPDETIPQAQWPENANPPSNASFNVGWVVWPVLILALLAGAAGVVVALTRRSRAPAPAPVSAAPAVNQMSPDGNQWWDGQRWIDSSHEAPPFAQRTDDGAYWWDGFSWRPVPQGPQPPSSGR